MQEVIKDYRDAAFKVIFDEPELFVQFLNGFSPIEKLKGLSPEAVEDMTERFTMLHQEERDADTVKRIRISADNSEMFVISIVEHESHVNHRMPFKLLQYMTYVWAEYEKEQQRKDPGCIYRKGFKYPPILPVVLYDGRGSWTAEPNMLGKVELGDLFVPYIPHFEYVLVNLRECRIEDLSSQKNALSLVLILDQLQTSEEFASIKEILPEGYLEQIRLNTPDRVLQVLANVIRVYMSRAGVSQDRIEETARTVVEGRFENMFSVFAENFAQEKNDARMEGIKDVARAMIAEGENPRKIKRLTKLPDDTIQELKNDIDKAKRMLLEGKSLEEVKDFTGLPDETIEKLRKDVEKRA